MNPLKNPSALRVLLVALACLIFSGALVQTLASGTNTIPRTITN
jgi:hypothetical protein